MCVRTSQSQTHMCRRPKTEGHKHTRTFCIYSWGSALPSVSSELSVNVSPPSSSPLSPSLTCGTKTPANFKHGCVCVCVFSMLPPIPDWCNTGPITVRCTSQRLIFDADCGFNKLAAGDGVRMCLHNTQRKKTAAFVSIINPSPLKKSCFLHLTLVSSHWCFWYWSASHFLESPSNIGLSQWNHQWNGWPAVLENICFLIANNKSQDCAVKNWWHLVI